MILRFLQGDEEQEYEPWEGLDDDQVLMLSARSKAVQISQTIAVTLSLLAAVTVAVEVAADQKAGAATSVSRILLGIMSGIILAGTARLLGVFPIPSEYDEFYAWGADGTTATCSLQGSVHFVGAQMVLLYDMALSVTYVLMVKYSWSSDRLWRMERIVHPLIGIVVMAALIGALVTDSFNPLPQYCWLASLPLKCGSDFVSEAGQVQECHRGEKAYLFSSAFQASVVLSLVISATAMVTLYCAVRKTEDRNLKYSSHLITSNASSLMSMTAGAHASGNKTMARRQSCRVVDNSTAHRMSRQVGLQGICYVSTLLLGVAPQATVDLVWQVARVWNPGAGGITTFLASSVGILYLMVFLRNRQHMRTRYGQCVQSTVAQLLPCRGASGCCASCSCRKAPLAPERGEEEPNSNPTDPPRPAQRRKSKDKSSRMINSENSDSSSSSSVEPTSLASQYDYGEPHDKNLADGSDAVPREECEGLAN